MSKLKKIYYLVSGNDIFDGTGIDRVSKALFSALSKKLHGRYLVEPVSLTRDGKLLIQHGIYGFRDGLLAKEAFPQPCDLILSVDLLYDMSQAAKDRLVELKEIGIPLCFVLHDLIPIRRPDWFLEDNLHGERALYLEKFKNWAEFVFHHATDIICISKHVMEDAIAFASEIVVKKVPRISYFHHGCDLECDDVHLTVANNSVASRFKFLIVGTLEPRKSQALVMDAYEMLLSDGHDCSLTIVGRAGKPWMSKYQKSLVKRIETHSELNKSLFFFEGITDSQLVGLYKSSSALLMLSEDEGFGLPLIEAAKFSLPVFARDIRVFREICQDGAHYFSGISSYELKDSLVEWMSNYSIGMHPKPELIAFKSWSESAESLIENLPFSNKC